MSAKLNLGSGELIVLTSDAFKMPQIDFEGIMRHLLETGKRTYQLWLTDETFGFIARGREYRSEYHINPSYEIQYSLKGHQDLMYRTPEGEIKTAHMPEGTCLFQPPLVPHSPRFAPDAFQFVIERARKPDEMDYFHWYCPSCDSFLHEEEYHVGHYANDPVGQAYANFYNNEVFRTCKKCGTVIPAPTDGL